MILVTYSLEISTDSAKLSISDFRFYKIVLGMIGLCTWYFSRIHSELLTQGTLLSGLLADRYLKGHFSEMFSNNML